MNKKRKTFFDEFFEDIFEDFDFENLGGGYSISITQTGDKTKIHVKADKNVDVKKLRRELEQRYPGAEIYIEGGKLEIEEIGKEIKSEDVEKSKKKSLIEVIDEKKIEE